MTVMMEVGRGPGHVPDSQPSLKSKEAGVGLPLIPEAQGAVPCFCPTQQIPVPFIFFQWRHLLHSNSFSKCFLGTQWLCCEVPSLVEKAGV